MLTKLRVNLLLVVSIFVWVSIQNGLGFVSAHRKFRGGRVKHPEYYGSGCPPSSLSMANNSDGSSFAMSVLFADFSAQTSATNLRDQKKCFINVELTVEQGMSIGIVHIDFRGYAYVPETSPNAFAHLSASYRMVRGVHGMIAQRSYSSGFNDDFYEPMDFNPIVWTPCENKTINNKSNSTSGTNSTSQGALDSDAGVIKGDTYWIRIESKIVAQKTSPGDEDVQIAIDSSDATMKKGLLQYNMISRPCA